MVSTGQAVGEELVVGGGCNAVGTNGDERLLRGRIYGCDHEDPNPGPRPSRTYAALVGGPLDGLLPDITG